MYCFRCYKWPFGVRTILKTDISAPVWQPPYSMHARCIYRDIPPLWYKNLGPLGVVVLHNLLAEINIHCSGCEVQQTPELFVNDHNLLDRYQRFV